jgi:hypothetical protein
MTDDELCQWLEFGTGAPDGCGRCMDAVAAIKALREENFALAANQCHDGYGDEYGNHRCRKIDTLQADSIRHQRTIKYAEARIAELEEGLRKIDKHIYNDNGDVTWSPLTIRARIRELLDPPATSSPRSTAV